MAIKKNDHNTGSFFNVDYNVMDKNLSPDQKKEWTNIYASYRSKTPLTDTVIGVDSHKLTVINAETKKEENKEILCLVLMNYRVKVIIPQTEIWYDEQNKLPDFVVRNMVGANIDYVVTAVDRQGECAIASRRMALGYRRNYFLRQNNNIGDILDCNILVVGPKRITLECNGFDFHIQNRDFSYTAIADLREKYAAGQRIKAKLKALSPMVEISVKEVNPNPFDGADKRHPVGSTRKAIISGTYAGGVFCTLPDDTTCLCLYSPGYFSEEFYINDNVLIAITQYDYKKKLIYGRLLKVTK